MLFFLIKIIKLDEITQLVGHIVFVPKPTKPTTSVLKKKFLFRVNFLFEYNSNFE